MANTSPDPAERTEPMPIPGHALPLDVWEQVCADAEKFLQDPESDMSETDFEEQPYDTGEDFI